VLTNQRVIVHSGKLAGKGTTTFSEPAHLTRMWRVLEPSFPGSGNLFFRRTKRKQPGGTSLIVNSGLTNVPDVAAVEKRIRETLLDPYADKLLATAPRGIPVPDMYEMDGDLEKEVLEDLTPTEKRLWIGKAAKRKRTVYVITNRRVLIWENGNTRSYYPLDLEEMIVELGADVIFEYASIITTKMITTPSGKQKGLRNVHSEFRYGFFDLENPREMEAYLRAVLVNPAVAMKKQLNLAAPASKIESDQ
jgi:hypothetical protein